MESPPTVSDFGLAGAKFEDLCISFHSLKKPDGEYERFRVRPLNSARVEEIKSKISGDTRLNSQLTVVDVTPREDNDDMFPNSDGLNDDAESQQLLPASQTCYSRLSTAARSSHTEKQYVILDGNHRFEAMLQVRLSLVESERGSPLPFQTVGCRVYENMPVEECLCIAASRNLAEGDRLQMTDFEVTNVIRNIRQSEKYKDIDQSPGESNEKNNMFAEIYKSLRAVDVSVFKLI